MSRHADPTLPRPFAASLLLTLFLSTLSACERENPPSAEHPEPARLLSVDPVLASLLTSLSPVPPAPQDPTNRFADDPAAAHFGQFLFFDTALSASSTMSCATCHTPQLAFTDGLAIAEAAQVGTRNTPAIWNTAHYPWLNWDGSADTLWAQATRPFEADHELASTRTTIARAIATDPQRRAAYEAIFEPLPDPTFFESLPARAMPRPNEPQHPDAIAWAAMSSEQQQTVTRIFINCCKAIAAYQRLLVSADSPFDRFAAAVRTDSLADWAAKGNPGFGEPELAGLDLFTGGADCLACHAGPLFSDFAFHSIRVAPTSGGSPTDAARFEGVNALFQSEFNSAGPHSDDPAAPIARRLEFLANPSTNWGRFKTPSLRNVALTAPYMHAGQFETLDRVLDHYSTFENALPPDHHTVQEGLLRPLQLTEAQRQNLVAFLHALTDISIDPRLLEQPNSPLPPSEKAKTGPEADG